MNLAFLGTGMIVKELMTTIERIPLENKYLLATIRSMDEAENMAKKYGFKKVYYDYDELLNNNEIDTVYVALPNHLHYSFLLKALEKGKNLIIEKPITANYKELEQLKRVALEKKLFIFEALSVVHMPAFLSLKENIHELGDLKIISLNYSQYSSRYDRFKAGEVLPVFDPHKAGGALMDLNIYNISFIVGLFGKPESIRYEANIEKGIDTSGILSMDYGSFKASLIAAKDCRVPVTCSLQCDKACIQMNHPVNGMMSYDLVYNNGESQTYTDYSDSHRLYYEFIDFIRAIENNDYSYMEERLSEICIVSKIMEEARKQAGIVFDNDLQ